MKTFPNYKQLDQMDCGPTCLRIISKYYGKIHDLRYLREISGINKQGVSLLGISEAAEKIGFRTLGARIGISQLSEVELPCILHWEQKHFVVLYRISDSSKGKVYHISDPERGLLRYNLVDFSRNWLSTKNSVELEGVLLLLSPSPVFFEVPNSSRDVLDFNYLLGYISPYKKLILQIFLGMGVGTILQVIIPFLTQAIVDVGINTRDLNFVYIVLIAQAALLLGRLSVEFIRSWILLHITTRLNVSILTDFLIKIMKLPISFFETKMTGDIMQRMSDQGRIQNFLTGASLNTIFTLFNLVVFSFILAYYNLNIFIVFIISSVLYSGWIIMFLRRRRELDSQRFTISSDNQSNVVQLISGMQEIKLNNCEQQKRWEWERIQARLFNFNIRSLALGQYQQLGAFFINEGKNIFITFLVAGSVINGSMTLGGMVAVQYIVGQLNSPIEQLLSFLQSFQDAKISLERLNEVHKIEDEDSSMQSLLNELPKDKSINIQNLNFAYPGRETEYVLNGINMCIPGGKTTAIVGMSGSGKTTILKILLRFYDCRNGTIKIGNSNIDNISSRYWRSRCGTIMQDGFIFSDSIANNIALGEEYPDMERLTYAVNVANIRDYIEGLPLGLNTKIGAAGNGISQGQKQRLLIARAVYKDPDYIFLDEATNALDANNERIIMRNLSSFLEGRTVVIVAHRLSTVKNADNIVVLEKGVIVEQGSHDDLIKINGEYCRLVENQLEL